MGNFLNKLIRNSSSASSGGGDDGTSRIAQTGVIALIGMLLVSMFAGPAAAASATGITATDVAYDNEVGEYAYTVTLNNYSANASETDSFKINHSATGISSSGVVIDSQTDGVTVESSSTSSGVTTVNINTSQSFDSAEVKFRVSGFDVTSSGTAEVTYNTYSDSFSFAPVDTGHGEITEVIKNDTGNQTSVDFDVINSSGDVIRNGSVNLSAYDSYPYGGEYTELGNLQIGDYDVKVYGVDGYQNSTKTLSISNNTTTSVSYSLDPSTGTVELGNISTWDNESVDSVDVTLIDAQTGEIVVDESNISDTANWSKQLNTGDYDYYISADGYADAEGSFSLSYDGQVVSIDPQFNKTSVKYEWTVVANDTALENFTFNLYNGSTISDGESPVFTANSSDVGSNTIAYSNLLDGDDYTLEVVYTDADGNETTYTENFTADYDQSVNGSVSMTVDVGALDDGSTDNTSTDGSTDSTTTESSDDGGFFGGSSNDGSMVMWIIYIAGGSAFVFGGFGVYYWLKSRRRSRSRFNF